ncbi:MAG: GNAT family N-acetyltransferase [Acidimicrobiaceae bacterium]|nr:GNAT family N-acetyltransferase [Acidimicrobiaceae bacterium]
MQTFDVKPLALFPQHWQQAAEWAYAAWHHEFPDDTVHTYLDQYALAASNSGRLLEIHGAITAQDELLAIGTLVDDDDLPGATEPGPWLAAVYVTPNARQSGIGSTIVQHIVDRSCELGYSSLFLYTENQQDWYREKGWVRVRETLLNNLAHTVMRLDITS